MMNKQTILIAGAIGNVRPFLFKQLLAETIERSDGMVLHISNETKREIDWDEFESIKNLKTSLAGESYS